MNWENTYGATILTPQVASGLRMPDPSIGGETQCDLNRLLPLDLIREHTKTDDVPSVSDQQLDMYRRASVEAAEQYTGLLISSSKPITESVETPWSRNAIRRMSFTHRTQWAISDETVYLYGAGGNNILHAKKGSREIKIPIMIISPDLSSSCCRGPCPPPNELNSGMRILYRAGYDMEKNTLPAGIILGMLKYVAWNITHPGDELYTVRNQKSNNPAGLQGTNNIAWASGALELWRQYDPDAI